MNRTANWIDYLFTRQRWVIHIFFWLFVLALYVIFFGRKNSNYLQTFFFVGLLMPVTIFTTYFLNYYLVPNYLMKDRYAYFATYFVYALIGSLFLEMMISALTFIVMAELNIHDMSPASIDLFFLLASLLMVVFLAMGIKMLLHWKKSKEDYQKLMRDKIEAELKFLKVQLNPHFLFNTLNNLYYLSIEKSDQTPKAILALSEMLDYVLHEGKSQLVSLSREVTQLRNYIELEKLRYGNRLVVELTTNGNLESVTIPPMMLITLVENSFKHGAMPTADNSWIKIAVSNSDVLRVEIRNSWKRIAMGEGIGLTNIKSQLEILFPQKHSLEIDSSQANEFGVVLIIKP
jgi:LytS/YehU family sensor histidine kinase